MTSPYIQLRDARLPYHEQGEGPAVLLLHGALADHRMWAPHQPILGERYRAVAYTQRYFGSEPWSPDWPAFGVETHAADLCEVVRALGAGPVHLVAWSYAGHIAFTAALAEPQLFKSLFVCEPGVPSYIEDEAALDALGADAVAIFGPAVEAVEMGLGETEAVRRLIDGSGCASGYFDAQPEARRRLQLENARTLPLQLRQSEPPAIGCAQLASLKMPVCVTQGELTRPLFAIVSAAAAECIPHCTYRVVGGADHMWPDADAAGFARAVSAFLAAIA